MIINVTQTSSNLKQEYEIDSPDFHYIGKCGSVSRLQQIEMSGKDTVYNAAYQYSKWTNYIPFRYLFGVPNLTRYFSVKRNDIDCGRFIFSKHGCLKSFYVIVLTDNTILHCYTRLVGSYNYISVYRDDEQIALIETYLCCNDLKYSHIIYLLEDYDRYGEMLSLFVLYYANYRFTHRLQVNSGSYYEKGVSFSKYNDKYNPEWKERYFPEK